MTLGSSVSVAKKESGVTPTDRRRSQASRTFASDAGTRRVSEISIGAEPERPEAEHRLAGLADPEERGSASGTS